jgi:hypothetical protein
MRVRGKTVSIDDVSCSMRAQCIAICPRQALAWDDVPSAGFVADGRTPPAVQGAQYAAYSMSLYAQALGIGTRNLVGNASILNDDRTPRGRIFAVLGLGYPSVKLRNKVEAGALPCNGTGKRPRALPRHEKAYFSALTAAIRFSVRAISSRSLSRFRSSRSSFSSRVQRYGSQEPNPPQPQPPPCPR